MRGFSPFFFGVVFVLKTFVVVFSFHIKSHSSLDLLFPIGDNIRRVSRDIQQGLYSQVHINFIDICNPSLLEDLALQCVEAGRVSQVSSIWERYTDFISLESDLFTLGIQDSYFKCNDETITDSDAMSLVSRMVGGLVSCCVQLGRIPVIRANPVSPVARQVASLVCDALNQLITDGTLQEGGTGVRRMLLVIDDRNADMQVMLHHCPIYAALMHDVLAMHRNRVQVSVEGVAHSYDLDSQSDPFWRENRALGWHAVGPAVKRSQEQWRADNEQVKALQAATAAGNAGAQDASAMQPLSDAVLRLGAVTEAKRILDTHTNCSWAIAQVLNSSGFVHFWTLERAWMKGGQLGGNPPKDWPSLLTSNPDLQKGSPEDKLRLAAIGLLARQATVVQLEEVKRALVGAKDTSPLDYLMKRFGGAGSVNNNNNNNHSAANREVSVTSLVSKGWSALVQGGDRVATMLADYATEGDDELLKLSATVSVLMSNTPSSDARDPCRAYIYFDPKVGASASQTSGPAVQRKTTPFDDALVFVAGGGNYTEYLNVTQHARAQGRRVIYGTSELISPSNILTQMAKLVQQQPEAKK